MHNSPLAAGFSEAIFCNLVHVVISYLKYLKKTSADLDDLGVKITKTTARSFYFPT